jgi:bifunctional DNase/RNase
MVRVSLEDITVAGDGNAFMVLLSTEKQEIIPIVIGPLEAMSIAAGRSNEKYPRPMTHDLMFSVMDILNANIKRIEISELSDNTFFAKLIIENRGIEFEIDSRSSDALALAVRRDIPIFISEAVIEKAALIEMPAKNNVEA